MMMKTLAVALAGALASPSFASPAGLTVGAKDKPQSASSSSGGGQGGGGGGPVQAAKSAAVVNEPVPQATPRDEHLFDDTTETPAPTDSSFQEINIGQLPTLKTLYGAGSGGGRPVIHIAGGKKWAIKIRYAGTDRASFPMLIGGTNGNITGGSVYTYKAAFSSRKGVLEGPDVLCPGRMTHAAYTTCKSLCNMQWLLKFNHGNAHRYAGDCFLEGGRDYYLNIAPEGPGCVEGEGPAHQCPVVMEAANGGTLMLNPGGPAESCRTMGWGYDPQRGCVAE